MGYGAPRVKFNPQATEVKPTENKKEEILIEEEQKAAEEEEEDSKEVRIPLTFVKKKSKKGDVNKYVEK